MSVRSLVQLERSLYRAVETLKVFQSENKSLKQEIRRLKQDLEEFERQNQSQREHVRVLEQRCSRIRTRVHRLIQNLATLEEPVRETGKRG